MPDLTELQKKKLEKMERAAQLPLKPIVMSNPDKFSSNVLVPASEYLPREEIAITGERRPKKAQRKLGTPPVHKKQ